MLIESLFPSHANFHHFIVAPHHDDEVIGCFQIMQMGMNWTVIHTTDNPLRRNESINATVVMGVNGRPNAFKVHTDYSTLAERIKGWIQENHQASVKREFAKDCYLLVWFPDPDFETHPEHKFVGAVGRMLAAQYTYNDWENVLFGFYSVNMLAPYVHTLSPAMITAKKDACAAFITQKGYFDSHGEACIFEGRYLV